jgi:hypothetical protein
VQSLGKAVMVVGLVLVGIGILFQFTNIGRLPGDVVVRRKNFTFYAPLMTSLILSLAVTLIVWLVRRR